MVNEMARATVLEQVLLERERQDQMYGDQITHSDEYWNVIATEENGEVARSISLGPKLLIVGGGSERNSYRSR